MKNSGRTMLLWAFIGLLVLMAFVVAGNQQANKPIELSYSELREKAERTEVKNLIIQGEQISGALVDGTTFRATGPADPEPLMRLLSEHGVSYDFKKEAEQSWLMLLLVNGLPVVLILLIFVFMMRQLQVGGGKAMSFGKSKARLLSESSKRVSFEDVAGCDEAKQELEEIIHFLKDPRKFTRLGGRIPKGVLLMGPPGTGKTLLARAVAGEAGVPFFCISGSDFVEMFVGVGASRVRDLFEQGKKNAPCIIFIDEIDAVGRHRGAGLGGGHDEREQTLNQLLVEMDGFESNEGVIIMAATNRPDVLDPALLRPGRFDRRVNVATPDVQGRQEILEVHTRKTPLAEDVDLRTLARSSPGMNGAELENLVNEAALLAARLDKKKIDMSDFEAAKDKVFMGPERRSLVISDHERRSTAYHEAGHAIVAAVLPDSDRVHKVTITPRGRALGLTWFLPNHERHSKTSRGFRASIAMAMGGRAAEELVLNEVTTGAANDIRQATDIARNMVCRFGMSEQLGPVSWDNGSEQVFLGRDIVRRTGFSQTTLLAIDNEVRTIVEEGYTWAKGILSANIHILHKIAQLLLEKETLDGEEFRTIVEAMDPVLPEGIGSPA
jgi:cell division protease FtsH